MLCLPLKSSFIFSKLRFFGLRKPVAFGEPLLAPGYDGLNQLTIQNAAYLSAWKGCTVQLPFDEAEYDAFLAARQREASRPTSGSTPMESRDYNPRWQIQW